jgi:hypothetical protein
VGDSAVEGRVPGCDDLPAVGGIHCPKQRGQSGQPMPEPVLRTTEPAKISKYTSTSVLMPQP